MPLRTVYNVVTKYTADVNEALGKIDQLQQKTDRLSQVADAAGERFRRLGSRIATGIKVGVSAGVGYGVVQMFRLQKEAEGLETSIASALSMNKVNTFNEGIDRSRKLMTRWRREAIASPGESRDLANIVATSLPGFAKLNPTNDQMTEWGIGFMGLGASQMGGDMDTTARQAQMMMMGRGGAHNKLSMMMQNPLFEELGLKMADGWEGFNTMAKESPEQVFGAILSVLKKMEGVNEHYANTFGGLWSSTMEHVNMTLLKTGGPVFDELREQLRKLVGWFTENRKEINKLAEAWGGTFAKGIGKAAEALKLAGKHSDKLVAGAKGYAVYKGASFVASAGMFMAGAALQMAIRTYVMKQVKDIVVGSGLLPQAWGGLKKGAGKAKGFVVGGAKRAVGGAAGFAKGSIGGAASGAMGSVIGAGSAAGASTMPGLAGFFGAAGTGGVTGLAASFSSLMMVLAPLTVILGMVVGTFMVLRDSSNEMTQYLSNAWGRLKLEFMKLKAAIMETPLAPVMEALGKAWDWVSGIFDNFGEKLKSFATWLGEGVVGALGLVTDGLAWLISGFHKFYDLIKLIAYSMAELWMQYSNAGGGVMGFKELDLGAAMIKADQAVSEERRARERDVYKRWQAEQAKAAAKEEAEKRAKETDKPEGQGAPTVDLKMEINQEIHTDDDPDRIAFKTSEAVTDQLRRARMSVLSY